MTPEAWGFAGLIVTQLGAGCVAWLHTRKQAAAQAAVSREIVEKVRPVSNGFAAGTLDRLDAILLKQGAMEQVVTDMRDRLNTHEIASNANHTSQRHDLRTLAASLTDHVAGHAAPAQRRNR